jgi:hypothetical protein
MTWSTNRFARWALTIAVAVSVPAAGAHARQFDQSFTLDETSEVVAAIVIECRTCAWEQQGHEAVVMRILVDGRYSQHLPIVHAKRTYAVMLGPVEAGRHVIRVEEDRELTSSQLRGGQAASVKSIELEIIGREKSRRLPLSLAPFVYARPDTVGGFTDVPVFMWYEVEPTARGTRYRYSVIFTNEDGGTPADRLMATWGRTTDIEYVYSVEVNATGAIVDEDMQGPKHETLKFNGQREGRHPLLWVSTENNMVLDRGTTAVRYAPAPDEFPLQGVSREAVMDRNAWLYELMAKELAREGKIAPHDPPGKGTIPDPRRYAYVEGCGQAGEAALAVAVQVAGNWIASDRGVREYRVARDGCFRVAIPLPEKAEARDVRAIRVQAYAREGKSASAAARLTRINTLFGLDSNYRPGPRLLQWTGNAALAAGGPPLQIPVK